MPANHQLRLIEIGDDAAAWRAAGFAVVDGVVTIGNTVLRLIGSDGDRGIRAIAVDDILAEDPGGTVDGIQLTVPGPTTPPPTPHPNGVGGLDHLVALSPDVARTSAALERAGLELRRTRRFGPDDAARRQDFFWLGDVILELVGGDRPEGEGPAQLWGIAVTADLDAAAALLGDGLGAPRDAVQAGRRIATVRTEALDISVPIALMTPHAGTGDPARTRR